MGLFSTNTKLSEQTPTEKVERVLGVFTQTKKELQELQSEFESERAILEDQLAEVAQQGDRVAETLSKIKALIG